MRLGSGPFELVNFYLSLLFFGFKCAQISNCPRRNYAKRRIAVLSVRIWVSSNTGEFRLFPTISVSLVLREPFEIEFGTIILGSIIYQKDQNYRKDPKIPERTKVYV